jgi:hypothetical protein
MSLSGPRTTLGNADAFEGKRLLRRAQTAGHVLKTNPSTTTAAVAAAHNKELKRSKTTDRLDSSADTKTTAPRPSKFGDDPFESHSSTFSLKSNYIDPYKPSNGITSVGGGGGDANEALFIAALSKNMSQAELEYTMRMTRAVPKEQLTDGLSLINRILKKNADFNPNTHRSLLSRMSADNLTSMAGGGYARAESSNSRPLTPASGGYYLLAGKKRPLKTGGFVHATSFTNSSTTTTTTTTTTNNNNLKKSTSNTLLSSEDTVNPSSTSRAAEQSNNNTTTVVSTENVSSSVKKHKVHGGGDGVSVTGNEPSRRVAAGGHMDELFGERAHSDSLLSFESGSNDSFYNVPVINRRALAHSAPVSAPGQAQKRSAKVSKDAFAPLPDKKQQHVKIVEPPTHIYPTSQSTIPTLSDENVFARRSFFNDDEDNDEEDYDLQGEF